MANTTNFGWETPDDTDLVKDGAASIRTLGSAIDTSLVDLKGGTTGQVLSKASNTDMDFTWVAQDDSNAIQNAIVDAKGDLISATAADTPARLAVGADGTYLQADSTTSTGLKWGTVSAGGMTLLSTTTMSGSSTTVSGISTSYTNLQIVIQGVTNNTANGRFVFYPNSNTSISSSIYWTSIVENRELGSLYLAYQRPDRTNNNNAWVINITDYASTTLRKPVSVNGGFRNESNLDQGYFAMGIIQTTSAITSFEVSNDGGNFAGGTIKVYGVK